MADDDDDCKVLRRHLTSLPWSTGARIDIMSPVSGNPRCVDTPSDLARTFFRGGKSWRVASEDLENKKAIDDAVQLHSWCSLPHTRSEHCRRWSQKIFRWVSYIWLNSINKTTPRALSDGTIPDPKRSKICRLPPVISGTDKAMDFKFGW